MTTAEELIERAKAALVAWDFNAQVGALVVIFPELVAALELCDEALLKLCDSSRELRATNKKLRDALKAAQAENERLKGLSDWQAAAAEGLSLGYAYVSEWRVCDD